MQLTPNFSREELERSELAVRWNIPNICPSELMPNLQRTAELLEQVRSFFGNPVIVSSGYRCPQINALAGGAVTSAHMKARAADFKVVGLTPREAATKLAASLIKFDKLILEFDSWVHIQVEEVTAQPRGYVYTAKRLPTGVVYLRGIVT